MVNVSRGLTAGEIEMAREVFGDSIQYDKVRIHHRRYLPLIQSRNVTMTPNGHMYFPENGDAYQDDFSKPVIDEKDDWNEKHYKGHFIHEMTHIWQKQQGYWVKTHALESALHIGYDPKVDTSKKLSDYTMEAQGDILEGYYLAKKTHEAHQNNLKNLPEHSFKAQINLLADAYVAKKKYDDYRHILHDFIKNPNDPAHLPKSRDLWNAPPNVMGQTHRPRTPDIEEACANLTRNLTRLGSFAPPAVNSASNPQGSTVGTSYPELKAYYIKTAHERLNQAFKATEKAIDQQKESLASTLKAKPHWWALPGKKKDWQNSVAAQSERLEALNSQEKDLVHIRDGVSHLYKVTAPMLDDYATLMLRQNRPKLALEWDSQQKNEKTTQSWKQDEERQHQNNEISTRQTFSRDSSARTLTPKPPRLTH